MKRIGIYGGAFNPVTKAHMEVAEKAFRGLSLDTLIFEISHKSYKNSNVDFSHRLKMLRSSIVEYGYVGKFKVGIHDNFNFDNNNRQPYAYETLDFYKQFIKDGDELYYIIGNDEYEKFDEWKKPDYILENYKLVVIGRRTMSKFPNVIKEHRSNIWVIQGNNPISSTEVRDHIKHNVDISQYVPLSVVKYLELNGWIYRVGG